MRSPVALTAALATLAVTAGSARAHDVRGYVSARGIDFIEAQVPTYVPESFQAPAVTKDFLCVSATQKNTDVNLKIHNLDISMPETNKLRLDLAIEVHAAGQLDVDNPYACLGSAACTDRLDLDYGRAIIDFDIRVENGVPRAALSNVDLMVSKDDIAIKVADCAIDGVINTIADFGREWLLGYLLGKAEDIAQENVGPMLEQMLGGFMHQQFSIGPADVSVGLDDLLVDPSGLQVKLDIDATSDVAPAECVGDDPGEPQSQGGDAPDFSSSMDAHLGVAVNFGLVNDAMYHVWRGGLTCVTGDQLEALGIELPYDQVTAMLPGFPPGTELGIAMRLASPPHIVGRASEGASMTLAIDGIELELIATLPDGSEKDLGMSMDLEAGATVAIDPATNALVARLDAAEMKRMEFDQQAAAQLGFDPAQIRTLVNDGVVPKMLEEMGDLPVTGSMFAFADYAIILRNLDTSSDAYLTAEVDLFRAPANDTGAPDTAILESPSGIASPKSAILRVGGSDPEIPSELLRYEVVVDGVARPLSAITRFTVGDVGVTKTYKVQVAAVDLSGNRDPSPATIDLTVDGIAPAITLAGERAQLLPEGGTVDLSWTATDDTSPEGDLYTSVKIYKLDDPQDAMSAKLVEEHAIEPGQSRDQVVIESGSVYRVEVEVTDQAGNTATSAVMIDAGTGGCGCNTGATPGGALPLLLALLGASLVMRRRRLSAV